MAWLNAIMARATAQESGPPLEAGWVLIQKAVRCEVGADRAQLARDGGAVKDGVIGVENAAGRSVRCDVHERKAVEMRPARAAGHDGVTAQIAGQADRLAGFPVARVCASRGAYCASSEMAVTAISSSSA